MGIRLQVYLSIFTLSIAVACIVTPPVSAKNTTFTQKLLPLDCKFIVVDTGTGTLEYLTPKECGVVSPVSPNIPPLVPSSQPSRPEVNSNPTPRQSIEALQLPTALKPTSSTLPRYLTPDILKNLLNRSKEFSSGESVTIDITPRQTFYFYLLHSDILHSLYILKIEADGVLVQFSHLTSPTKLFFNQPTEIDLNYDHRPDIRLNLTKSSSTTKVHLEIQLLVPHQTGVIAVSSNPATPLITGFGGAALVYVGHRHIRKRKGSI